MSLWGELERRNVFKVAVAYLVASWLIVQVVGVLTEPLNLPDVLDTVVVVLLAIGFPFALVIAWIYDVTPEGIRVTSHGGGTVSTSTTSGKRLTYVVIGLFVLAVGLMAVSRFTTAPRPDSFGAGSRLAILPCADLSPDPSNAFFAPGMHQELIRQLSSLSGLEVISPSSVQQYAGAQAPAPQVAEQLQVQAVMECSALYSGDQVRLTTLLVDGASAASLWSSVYPADMSNVEEIFRIQADIAAQVANALSIEFLEAEMNRLGQAPTASREAFELYLAANAARLPGTVDGMQRAVALLDEALAADATYVEAWALLANLKTIMSAVNPAEVDVAISAAETAIELEPLNGAGYAELGFALGSRREWQEAEVAYQRALELGWPLANMPQYSTQQLAVGHIDQAIITLESNLESDPMNPVALGFLMTAYDSLGDVAKADELYERGRTLHGDWPFGGNQSIPLRLGRGDLDFLREEVRPFIDETNEAQAVDAELLDAANDPERARMILERYASDPARVNPGQRWKIAYWAGYLGEVDLAMEALRDASTGGGLLVRGAWEPVLRDARSTPEFLSLIDELGLVDFWNETEWPEFCQQSSDGRIECG